MGLPGPIIIRLLGHLAPHFSTGCFSSRQAIKDARDFQKQTKMLVIMKNRDSWSELNNFEKMLTHDLALKAEGLVCTALSSVKVPGGGVPSQTLKWARDVTRDVLGEIAANAQMEELCHPTVLQESRNFISSK